MEKVIKALLEAKYPTANVDALLEVVSNTPDSVIATEILCGIYTEPVISKEPCQAFIDNKSAVNQHNIQLVGYNKWTRSIEYTYQSRKSKYAWHLKSESAPSYDEVTPVMTVWSWDDLVQKIGIIKEDRELWTRTTVYGELETGRRTEVILTISDWNG